MIEALPWRAVVVIDFEFGSAPGARPEPRCVAALDLKTGADYKQWLGDGAPVIPPYPHGEDVLTVTWFGTAEFTCYDALNWPMPRNVIDTYVEFKRQFCGSRNEERAPGLLDALTRFGLPAMGSEHKEAMRDLALRGGAYTEDEKTALMAYNFEDVEATAAVFRRLLPCLDFPRALLRGRYLTALAKVENAGVPLDVMAFERLTRHWQTIKTRIAHRLNRSYGVFVPTGRFEPDSKSEFGAAVLAAAAEHKVDSYAVAEVADSLYRGALEATAEVRLARLAARKATGLTVKVISAWEDAGRDASHWFALDEVARELATELPALGLGPGYAGADGADATDYAAALWALLREPDPPLPRRMDFVRRAAEVVAVDPRRGEELRPLKLSRRRLAVFARSRGIAWPKTPSGLPCTDDEVLKELARRHPALIGPLRDVLNLLSKLKVLGLTVGPDGRNRCLLSPFASRTGRNQPSNARFIFGPSAWLRSLIRPAPGMALAYLDFSAQELAIAARLSGDEAMQAAYASGDPYLTFAKAVGEAPEDATKKTHQAIREVFKVVSLGVLYGMSGEGLARKLDCSKGRGKQLLRYHKRVFPRYWEWSDKKERAAFARGSCQSQFGWRMRVHSETKPTTVRNFYMQANGAEMLRIAIILAAERGIRVVAPVHDALMIEAPTAGIADAVEAAKGVMVEAGMAVLDGFRLRVDAKVVRHPERYQDERGTKMWDEVMALLDELDDAEERSRTAEEPIPD